MKFIIGLWEMMTDKEYEESLDKTVKDLQDNGYDIHHQQEDESWITVHHTPTRRQKNLFKTIGEQLKNAPDDIKEIMKRVTK
jgi:hypothetical protein